MFRLKLIIISIVMLISGVSFAESKKINVSSSIIPIQSLVAMVLENTNNSPSVVFSNADVSPHNSSINYKGMKTIKNAQIIFLVSKNFEIEIIQNIDESKTKVIYLDQYLSSNISDFNNLSYKRVSSNSNHSHHDKHHVKDYHIWLDTNKSKEILKIIATELSKINPDDKKKYNENVAKYSAKLNDLEKSMGKDLSKFKSNFMVYHNGWGYFIKENKLNKYFKGSIITNEDDHHHVDTNLSAKNVLELTSYIKENNISCILLEPQFEDSTVKMVIENNNIKTAVLDPIGTPTKTLVDNYFLMMKKNTQQLKSCI